MVGVVVVFVLFGVGVVVFGVEAGVAEMVRAGIETH